MKRYIKASGAKYYKITMDYDDSRGDNYHFTTYTNNAKNGIANVMVDYAVKYHRTNFHAPTEDEESEARTHINVEEINSLFE